MKIVSDKSGDLDLLRVAGVSVGRNHHRTGRGPGGDSCYEKIVRTDDDRAFDVSKLHAGLAQFRRPQGVTCDADLSSRQCCGWIYSLNARISVYIFLAEETVRNSHELNSVIAVTSRNATRVA